MLSYATDYNKCFISRIFLIEQELMEEEENFLIESLSILQEGIIAKTISKTAQGTTKGVTSAIDGAAKGATANIKKYFDSFIAALKGIFKRFIDNVTRLFKSHEKWLADNESNIKNANLKGLIEEIFPYWQNESFGKKMCTLKILDSDIDTLFKQNAEEKEIREFYLTRIGMMNKGINTEEKDKFTADVKVFLRGGGSRIIKENEIRTNIPGIFEFCKGYKNSYNDVKQAISQLEYFCKRADKLFNINNQALQQQGIDPNKAKENKLTKNESYTFNFFLEDQPSLKDKVESSGKATTPAELNQKLQKEETKQKSEVEERKEREQQENDMVKGNASVSQGEKIKLVKTMLNTLTSFVTIRMEIIEEKFKVYMRFLRKIAHKSMGQSLQSKADGNSVVNGSKLERVARKVTIHTKK